MKRAFLAFAVISLAVVACKNDTTKEVTPTLAPPIALDSGTSTQAASMLDGGSADASAQAAASVVPVYHAYKGRTFFFGTERRGDAIRAVYFASGTPIDLHGKATDATHFSAHQSHVPKGEKAISITGEESADGSTLTATLTDPHAKKTTALSSNQGPFAGNSQPKFKADFKGSLGGRFIRMKLERADSKLSGIYRYSKSAQDITLAGTVTGNDGTFDLTESVKGKITGKFSGVFISTNAILANWSSPDGTHTFPVEMQQGDGYPETLDLGSGLSMYPQETMIEGTHCRTDIVFPQVRGAKDKAKETLLNGQLKDDNSTAKTCQNPDPDDTRGMDYEVSDTYALLTAKKGRFVSLSQSGYSFTGGAHGNGGSRCNVLDTANLTLLRMVDSLTKEGHDKLSDLVTKSLQAGGGGDKLTDQMYYNDHIDIGKDTNICLTDTQIQVQFMPYEIAPYAAGAPEADFPKADVRAFFEKNEVMDAVFAQ